MIFRFALFISLLSLFYYYCEEDSSTNYFREPNDINMIDVPVEISPTLKYESIPETSIEYDSSVYSTPALPTNNKLTPRFLSSVPQNF